MKRSLKVFAVVLSVVFFAAVSGRIATAQCGGPAKKASFGSRPLNGGGWIKAAAFSGSEQSDSDRDKNGLEPIVGLWKIAFVDKAQNYSDTGYAAWHSDFTEFQNSERTPSTGAVCQGVWEKVGPRTYKLNHFALAYGDSLNLTNVIRIREEVVVDESHKSFSGTFITDVYDTNHNFIIEYAGPITGKRVTRTLVSILSSHSLGASYTAVHVWRSLHFLLKGPYKGMPSWDNCAKRACGQDGPQLTAYLQRSLNRATAADRWLQPAFCQRGAAWRTRLPTLRHPPRNPHNVAHR